MKLSFCITCKNRIHQIRQTLPENLLANSHDQGEVEFILVDFGSSDGLQDWLLGTFGQALDSGYLKYYYTESMTAFHCSIAKNLAHKLASGQILTNLDADNFTGPRGGDYVYQSMANYHFKAVFHQWSGVWHDGTCGRISCRAEDFWKVGGYDESFEPAGYQDLDLLARLELGCGLTKISTPNLLTRIHHRLVQGRRSNRRFARAIPNSKEQTMQTHLQDRQRWVQWENSNKQKSMANISQGHFLANSGKTKQPADLKQYSQGKLVGVEAEPEKQTR
jgi:glycosyltransferase involved in cell wall biosynthesis